ncbi:MAG: WD40-repeat-containing domain protein [Benniella sp.]|nr:MAG: WD40-repeat-containing domain protein [Benniella sp.]
MSSKRHISTPDQIVHQGNADSNPSFEILDTCEGKDTTPEQELDFNSPLVWSSISGPTIYSPKEDLVASGSSDATVRLWDVEAGSCRQTLTGHNNSVLTVAGHSASVVTVKCSPNRDLIASGSGDSTIRLWDVDTGACRRTLGGHTGTVFSVAYSPLGDLMASGGDDKSVRLWKTELGECLHILNGHDN